MIYEKIYVSVGLNIDVAGNIRPVAIRWKDGRIYEIDQIKQTVKAASLKVGGNGIRYTVMIDGRERYLFDEGGRWFVEARRASN